MAYDFNQGLLHLSGTLSKKEYEEIISTIETRQHPASGYICKLLLSATIIEDSNSLLLFGNLLKRYKIFESVEFDIKEDDPSYSWNLWRFKTAIKLLNDFEQPVKSLDLIYISDPDYTTFSATFTDNKVFDILSEIRLPHLTELEISFNDDVDNSFSNLLRTYPGLTRLYYHRVPLRMHHIANVLAHWITTNSCRLESLTIFHPCEFDREAVRGLCNLLERQATFKRLILEGCELRKHEARIIFDLARFNSSINTIEINDNQHEIPDDILSSIQAMIDSRNMPSKPSVSMPLFRTEQHGTKRSNENDDTANRKRTKVELH